MPPEERLCRRMDCAADRDVLEFDDRFSTIQWLQRLVRDCFKMAGLRGLLQSESGGSAPHRLSDHDVIERIAALLVSGRVHVHAGPVLAQSTAASSNGSSTTQASSQDQTQNPTIDKNKVADYMTKNTTDTDTYHHQCAKVCHAGLAAGGLGWDKDRPSAAKDNGLWLLKHGAQVAGRSNSTDMPTAYSPQKGDVAVFSGSSAHPIGHMEIYDGKQWVSDTKQTTFSPARNYGGSVVIYRFPD
jgi:hypothetical protein